MEQSSDLPHQAMIDSTDSIIELLDLSKQQRNLLLLRPLFQLELNKHSIGTESDGPQPLFKHIDTHYLVLTALDVMMEGTTIQMGSTSKELLDRLKQVAKAMKPSLNELQAHRVAEVILDTLDNKSNSYRVFVFDYFHGAARETKTINFRLVSYEPDLEDVYRYRPTAEGYLVYLGMLDLAPEDAQEMMEKMLDLLVQRGRFDAALEFAKRARTLSLEYRQFIRDRLMQAFRAPGSVNWTKEVAPKLQDARTHVVARQVEDQRMTEAVRGALLSAEESKTRQDLAQLLKTLEGASLIRSNLVSDITVAPDKFLHAQRALFRARRPSGLPDLETRLLPDLLKLNNSVLTERADDAICGMYPAKWPKVYGLNAIFGLLLERRIEVVESDDDGGEIEPFVPPLEQFAPALINDVQAWVTNKFKVPCTYSVDELLVIAEAEGFNRIKQRCLVLMMFRSFSQAETLFPYMRAEAEGRFERDIAEGSNLHFSPIEGNKL
ncbi:hypothetical protein [Deefgea piscis]|uniref:hypothetical protein n=1 Tax=Deefgea piscis TaxID=2739061 RepID=UPI001C809F24|nr:hypothetical protein [Deefgea piscis]QZA82257.1 hypothetical protein K4H25_06340 [Deefgea piscis]